MKKENITSIYNMIRKFITSSGFSEFLRTKQNEKKKNTKRMLIE